MLNDALPLSLVEESGTAVLTLLGPLRRQELLASRLTRKEVSRHLLNMADALASLPTETRARLASLDFDGWTLIARGVRQRGAESDEALWFAVSSLVPATLIWLRHYRKADPELFSWTPKGIRDLGTQEP